MTFAEFEQLPEEESRRCELHHGELITVAEVVWGHYTAQGRVRDLLQEAGAHAAWSKLYFHFGRLRNTSTAELMSRTPRRNEWTRSIPRATSWALRTS